MLKIFKTYWKARKLFVFPKINVQICKWRKSGCLPVWRRGNQIKLAKHYSEYETKYDYAKLINSWWTDEGKAKHPILSKLFKHPVIQLPIWLSFYWFDWDVCWKWKWDEIRYEFNPLFSVVFFGISFNIWLSCPVRGEYFMDDHYWECILNYVYGEKPFKDIVSFTERMSKWSRHDAKDDLYHEYYTLQPEYLKESYRSEYLEKIKEYRK